MVPDEIRRHGLLQARDNAIVDAHDKLFVMRGVSLFWSQWKSEFFNEDVVAWLRNDWKINVVRAPLAVHHGGYLQNPAAETAKIEVIIQSAIKLGLYVIVDWHAHDRELDAAVTFFNYLAGRYHDCPNLIYEVWNEPGSAYSWLSDIYEYHTRVIEVIRKNGATNLIVAGTEHYCQRPEKAACAPLRDGNIAYAVHFYAATHGGTLRRRIFAAKRNGCPVLVTEFGTSEASGTGTFAPKATVTWLNFLESEGIGYLNWSIADKDETAAALVPGASLHGCWQDSELTASGRLVRSWIRSFAP